MVDDSINIIIPMGGIGSRFRNEGYRFPKPLINIGEFCKSATCSFFDPISFSWPSYAFLGD